MLDDAYANGEKTGYVANLGHGITQWVDPANPKAFVDTSTNTVRSTFSKHT